MSSMRSCMHLGRRLAGVQGLCPLPALAHQSLSSLHVNAPSRSGPLCSSGVQDFLRQGWPMRSYSSSDEGRGDTKHEAGAPAEGSNSNSGASEENASAKQPQGTVASEDGASEAPASGASSGNAMTGTWRAWINTKLSMMEEEVKNDESSAVPVAAQGSPQEAAGAAPPEGTSTDPLLKDIPPTVVEPLAHPFFGFSELGGVGKEPVAPRAASGQQQGSDGGFEGMVAETPPRLSPSRLFYPGQTYSAGELNPFSGDGDAVGMDTWVQRPRPVDSEVRSQIDYKDRRFLSSFLSEQGQLLPRRRTKLRAKTHRKIMRAVKLARCMALLPPTSKLPQYAKQKNPYSSRTR